MVMNGQCLVLYCTYKIDESNGALLARWRGETYPGTVGQGRRGRSQAIADERPVQGLKRVYKRCHEKSKVATGH